MKGYSEIKPNPSSRWPRLRDASPEQRAQFELSYSGIHWPTIDEDLSFEGMFHAAGLCDISDREDNVYFIAQGNE